MLVLLRPPIASAQQPRTAIIRGTVIEASTAAPIPGAQVSIEDTRLAAVTDSAGNFLLLNVPPGPRTLTVEMLGYATARLELQLAPGEVVQRRISLAVSALEMDAINVTADAAGRARGETGTATVVNREAIANQTAASVQGVLELVPGTIMTPPGLDGPQQFALRAMPTAGAVGAQSLVQQRSAESLASFGTAIIMDGVPLSNNANLQSLGPRAETFLPGTAGGGIDLRRIPASTLERVEVIRGLPSVRYGDLTQGAVVLYTRAGRVTPELSGQLDPRTGATAGLAGANVGGTQAVTGTFDAARTLIAPGARSDVGWRLAGQLAHRYESDWGVGEPALVVDTRADGYQLLEEQPVQQELTGDQAYRSRDRGLRVSNRTRLRLDDRTELSFAGAVSALQQESFRQTRLVRPAMPFTDRLTEGRQEGHYVLGHYVGRVDVDGTPWQVYGRTELERRASGLGLEHEMVAGLTFRREWNDGPGVQFDIERPLQVDLGGVQGFDRPRRYDEVPPLVASALFVGDRATAWLGSMFLEVQAGVRADVLHDGAHWLSGARDLALQPRLQLQLSLLEWLRLRGSVGRTSKLPDLGSLFPAPQYYDLVNVNYFANDPADRLAVLTTFIRDPTNPALGMARADKAEAGFDLLLGDGSVISIVAYADRLRGGMGTALEPTFLLRERFDVTDTPGDGEQPVIGDEPVATDTVPILLHRPSNNLDLDGTGIELTAVLPEIDALNTRFEVQAAYVRTELIYDGIDFGSRDRWSQFQANPDRERSPYWEPGRTWSERAVLTYRGVYRDPALGLSITGAVQHYPLEERVQEAATDTLAFAGYVTRTGELVEVPPERRADPEFADLRFSRTGLLVTRFLFQPDWMFSLQVAKTLPGDGRLSFYAFNALDRRGTPAEGDYATRSFLPARFGVELRMPLGIFR